MMDDSSLLLDFFRQVAPLLGLTCLSGILVIVWLVYVINVRRRKQAQLDKQKAVSTDTPANEAFRSQASDDVYTDLPDLDLLLDPLPVEAAPSVPVRRETTTAPTRVVGGAGPRTVYLDGGIAVDAIEVLTILRDVADGGLIVQIGDKAYRGQDAVDNPEVKRRFASVMRELSGLAQSLSSSSPAPAPAQRTETAQHPSPVRASQPEPSDDSPSLSDLLNPTPVTRNVPPPPAPDGNVPGMLPSFKLDDNPLPPKKGGLLNRAPKPDPTPIPELNIAGAIEAYLQHKLAYSEYANRAIHVHSAPGGGVRIEVDGRFYEAVGDIEDTAVRAYIAQTIEEWQDRH